MSRYILNDMAKKFDAIKGDDNGDTLKLTVRIIQ